MPDPGPPARGPLAGVRLLEFAGIGPVPFAAMVLADLGADGIRLDRPRRHGWLGASDAAQRPSHGGPDGLVFNLARSPVNRGRASVAVDLKHPDGVGLALRLVERADVLLEGFRPGVMERLGLGPDVCLARNERLVYGRMTGWGQDGPLAGRAGHDLTYLAVSGVLRHIGRAGAPPTPPLNLVADYGGGGMLLVAGVLAALLEASRSGRGQVVDAAMVDGSALLMTFFHGFRAEGLWRDETGTNLLDSGAPFYDVYATADGGHVAVGALEPQFYAELVRGLGLSDEDLPDQYDVGGWPVLRERFAAAFATRTRDEWAGHFAGTDACVAPVLSMSESPDHPHVAARTTFATVDGVVQPSPAPRFSRTPAGPPAPVSDPGAGADRLLDWGIDEADLAAHRASGAIM